MIRGTGTCETLILLYGWVSGHGHVICYGDALYRVEL